LRYSAELDEPLAHCIWAYKGIATFDRNDTGPVVVSSPGNTSTARTECEFNPRDYCEVDVPHEIEESRLS
jgi:hypothetical protein